MMPTYNIEYTFPEGGTMKAYDLEMRDILRIVESVLSAGGKIDNIKKYI